MQFGDQTDSSRWIHVGTSPSIRKSNQSNNRRINQASMKEGFIGGYSGI
jgi:hypothetical protein